MHNQPGAKAKAIARGKTRAALGKFSRELKHFTESVLGERRKEPVLSAPEVREHASANARPPPGHKEIAERAAALWRRMGCPHSCDVAIWLEAEQKLANPGLGPDENRGIGLAGAPFDSGKIMAALNSQFPGPTGPATTSL